MTPEQSAACLLDRFPEKQAAYRGHIQAYHKLLGHVFFADEINNPLVALLEEDKDRAAAEKYCAFIEEMWFLGDSDVKNIVEVTIIERLSDHPLVWTRFGQLISKEFRWEINDVILPRLSLNVSKLPTAATRKHRRGRHGKRGSKL